MGKISEFIHHHYRHFNAVALIDAADAYGRHLDHGGQMLVTLAGAMSTAELGLSLAEMIREGKIHAISCTGANLEEDIYNLVAHDYYMRLPDYRELSAKDEEKLMAQQLFRVTDTCIPEEEAVRRLESAVLEEWLAADRKGEAYFPHEFFYRILPWRQARAVLPDRPKGQLGASRRAERPADRGSRLGGLYARQHLREPCHQRPNQECPYGSHRHRIHD